MTSFAEIMSELKARYEPDSQGIVRCNVLAEADLGRWMDETELSRTELYDKIAAVLADGFHRRELEFSLCDAIVNDLWSLAINAAVDTNTNGPLDSHLFCETFNAFDAGEYYHNNDRSKDPIETYTRPRIAAIVSKQNESSSGSG